ncbi:flotillin-like FloA family protein [Ekhidna sp.]|uniref:flotillin-like FloA family protein n=1 Tax=Ekhidna sp. TaxID=2608089 RepID=UPI003B5B93DE
MNTELLILILFGAAILGTFIYLVPINLWLTALFAGVQISIMELVFMRIRKSPVKDIIFSLITSTKLGLGLTSTDLETHALAGGDVKSVVKTMGLAKNQNITLSFKEVASADLASEDLDKFLNLKKQQATPGSQEKREALARKIYNQLTDDQIDDLERYLGGQG